MSRYRPRGLYPPTASESYRRERHAAHFSERPKTMFDPDKTYDTPTSPSVSIHLPNCGLSHPDQPDRQIAYDVTVQYNPDYLRELNKLGLHITNIPRATIRSRRENGLALAIDLTIEELKAVRNAINAFIETENL